MSDFFTLALMLFYIATFGSGFLAAIAFWLAALVAAVFMFAIGIAAIVLLSFVLDVWRLLVSKLRGQVS